jgi:hypothetical protein
VAPSGFFACFAFLRETLLDLLCVLRVFAGNSFLLSSDFLCDLCNILLKAPLPNTKAFFGFPLRALRALREIDFYFLRISVAIFAIAIFA